MKKGSELRKHQPIMGGIKLAGAHYLHGLRMTRHSKNCTANTVYTYHERQKDAKHSGYGTQTVRLGKDSIRAFDCCCLTLQPAKDPVITQDGFIYDRAAILEYILSQKADIKRRQKIYAKQCDRAAREALEKKKAAQDEKARAFMALNTLDTHSKASAQAAESEALASVSKGNCKLTSFEGDYRPGTAASFWTQTPSASDSLKYENDIPKPDPVVRCPMSGKPLRYKDLITVNFTNLDVDDASFGGCNPGANEIRRVCAVSKDPLTSATRCFVLRPSGAVVTREVVEKIIRKEMVDPISGTKLVESDLIENQLEILANPDAFYNALEEGVKRARRRVVLATLYLGSGELEKQLIEAIAMNKNNPQVTLLADATRSTRTVKATAEFADVQQRGMNEVTTATQSSPLFLLQRIAKLPSSRVALYQSHHLRGWMRRFLPERLNELLGLQHMKVHIFDDDVIISGANLSEEYFKTRQDRAWLFRGVSALADFYSNLIDIIASLSYQVTPKGELRAISKETDPELANEKAYCSLFRSRIKAFLTEARTKYVATSAPRAYDTAVFPVVQMGAYGIQQETPLLQRLLHFLPPCDLAFTTGYFSPTHELEEAITAIAQRSDRPCSQVHILCAAPQANSFFNSNDLSGAIPAAYREMLISFLRRTARLPNLHVHEYHRHGWTFHAKGLWLTTREVTATTLAFIGSSNYGYRSRDLDIESQVVVVTRDVELRRRIEAERRWLWDARYLRPVTLEGLLRPTEPRFKWFARWTLPFLRRIIVHAN
ncbi:hypothetical protein TcWFU_008662 [Taenia crassiceps]|uniref:CDP-diacylglycerol--glycerol-3-phosphate 3-phosphatidyltransferase n=1 Tax=Taenia crassiceps TaxID=6207 RepID=A0ABR4Q9K8_9CEST